MEQIKTDPATIETKEYSIDPLKIEDVKFIVPKKESKTRARILTIGKLIDPKLRTCNICEKLFETREKMRMHRYHYHDGTVVQCGECQKQFIGRKYLRDHMRNHKSYTCNNCGELVKMNSYYSHTKTCFKIPPTKPCLYVNCDFRGYHNSDIRKHIKTHIKKDVKKKMCSSCNLPFDTTRDLKAHRTRNHPLFKCEDCQKRFRRGETLERHRSKTHVFIPAKSTVESQIYYCNICTFETKHRSNKAKHMKLHGEGKLSVKSIPRLTCEFCGFKFKKPYQLRVHEQICKMNPESERKQKFIVCF